MCLSIQGKVIELKDNRKFAQVDFGNVKKDINIELVKASPGDYVLVHAGFAIEIVDEKDIQKNIDMLNELKSS